LLRADDRPKAGEMLKLVRPVLARILDPKCETAFLNAMATGQYRPELLFRRRPELVESIRRHPALLWKAGNVARHVAGKRKPT
jgi:hypothetical protein